jgi:polar amino acid transport system substrate-binding protein
MNQTPLGHASLEIEDAAHNIEVDQPQAYSRTVGNFLEKNSMNEHDDIVRRQLAPQSTLRVAINLSNFLLVSGPGGPLGWRGVAPDVAHAVAQRLDVGLELLPHATPSEIADSAGTGTWTLALIGAEPARARAIAFSPSYAEIEASYLVPPGTPLQSANDVDRPGVRIVAFQGSAYGVWLEANLRHATLLHGQGFAGAFQRFRAGEADALASLKPKLLEDLQAYPQSRILPGSFMTVRQSIGVATAHREAAAWLHRFVEEMRASRFVEDLIRKHGIAGLTASAAEAPT